MTMQLPCMVGLQFIAVKVKKLLYSPVSMSLSNHVCSTLCRTFIMQFAEGFRSSIIHGKKRRKKEENEVVVAVVVDVNSK